MHFQPPLALDSLDPNFEAKPYVSVLVRLQQLAATPGDALQHSPLLALLADCRNGVELFEAEVFVPSCSDYPEVN